jgi:hypothetical protein
MTISDLDLFATLARCGTHNVHFDPDPLVWEAMVARGARVSPLDPAVPSVTRERVEPPMCEEMATLTVGKTFLVTRRVRRMTATELRELRERKEREAAAIRDADDVAIHGRTDPWRETAMKDKAAGL